MVTVTVTVMEMMMMMKVSWFGEREHEGQFGHFILEDKMIKGTPPLVVLHNQCWIQCASNTIYE